MIGNHGSCICGEVKYRLNSEILSVVNCHCNFCRSHSGAAFSTYVVLPATSLEITDGQEKLNSFDVREGKKHFCSVCGTPVFNLNKRYPGVCMIYYGTLDNAENIVPVKNVWSENKLEWVDNISTIKSVAQGVERKNA